jgi:hypothetical protein
MTSGPGISALALLMGGLLWTTPGLAGGSAATVPAQARENAAAVAALMDANRDGRISKAEFARHNGLPGRFATLDADGDGALTKDEQEAVNVGPRIQR